MLPTIRYVVKGDLAMFVGHYAVSLALKKVEPKLNLGWTFFAVMLLDALLGLFVLLGIEKATIPAN